jgi:hypothetical protein
MCGLWVTIERSESSIATARSASVSARSKGSALVAAVGDRSSFKNGRQFAAWLGLVPKQRSSGGRVRLCGISEDRYLRTLLIPRCPLDVDSSRPVSARSGQSPTAMQKGQIDSKRTLSALKLMVQMPKIPVIRRGLAEPVKSTPRRPSGSRRLTGGTGQEDTQSGPNENH